MSDSAFKTGAYPAYSIDQLRSWVADGRQGEGLARVQAEIERRERVAAGDVSVMTAGERLRFARKGA